MKRIHALPDHVKAMLAVITGFFCFATGDIFQKSLTTHYPASTIGVCGMLFCLMFLIGYAALRGQLGYYTRILGWRIYAIRATIMAVQYVFFLTAISTEPLATVYTLSFIAPLVLTILVSIFLHEHPTPKTIIVLIIGFSGVLIALRPGDWQLNIGTLCALGNGLLMAISYFSVRFFPKDDHWTVKTSVPLMIEVTVFAALLLLLQGPIPMPEVKHIPQFMISGAAMTFGLCLLVYAYAHGRAAVIAPFQYTGLIWGTLYGWLFFGNIIDIWTLSGAALIIGAGLWLFLSHKAPEPLPDAANSPKKDE